MFLSVRIADERRLGKHITLISQIRDAIGDLTVEQMSKYFKVTKDDCDAAVDCITAHPDWDDEKVAEEVDWED